MFNYFNNQNNQNNPNNQNNQNNQNNSNNSNYPNNPNNRSYRNSGYQNTRNAAGGQGDYSSDRDTESGGCSIAEGAQRAASDEEERAGRNARRAEENNFETLQNARKDLMGEIDAVIQYSDHIRKTDDRLAKATWENIMGEELTHVGELLGLLDYLAPWQKTFVESGFKEFNERKEKFSRE